MIPYIIVFLLNILFAFIAERSFEKQKKLCVLSFVIIGSINIIFVGLRDFGVGYDTNVYIEPYFDKAAALTKIADFFNEEDVDRGFLLLAYIAQLFSSDPQALLVTVEVFIMTFTLLGIYNLRKIYQFCIPVYLLFYWLVLFFFSENFMRQFCAMSLLFYGYSLYLRGYRLLYLFMQIVAIFFHSSSFLFLIVPVFDRMSTLKKKKRYIYTFIALLLLIVSALSYYYLLSIFGNIGVISEIYSDRYSELGIGSHNTGIQLGVWTLAQIAIQLFLIFDYKYKDLVSEKVRYLSFVLFVTITILQLMNAYNVNLSRLSLYFYQFYLLYLAIIFKAKATNKLAMVCLILLMVRYCVLSSFDYSYEAKDYSYSSKILNIKK